MAIFRNGSIPPVTPDGAGNNHQAAGLDRDAVRIVEDEDLLREVIRRACLVRPGIVREMLEAADERMTSVLNGGYVERFGRN